MDIKDSIKTRSLEIINNEEKCVLRIAPNDTEKDGVKIIVGSDIHKQHINIFTSNDVVSLQISGVKPGVFRFGIGIQRNGEINVGTSDENGKMTNQIIYQNSDQKMTLFTKIRNFIKHQLNDTDDS